jgi:hypothetical protein
MPVEGVLNPLTVSPIYACFLRNARTGIRAPQAVLPFVEGEAPPALLVEGATRAPLTVSPINCKTPMCKPRMMV